MIRIVRAVLRWQSVLEVGQGVPGCAERVSRRVSCRVPRGAHHSLTMCMGGSQSSCYRAGVPQTAECVVREVGFIFGLVLGATGGATLHL